MQQVGTTSYFSECGSNEDRLGTNCEIFVTGTALLSRKVGDGKLLSLVCLLDGEK